MNVLFSVSLASVNTLHSKRNIKYCLLFYAFRFIIFFLFTGSKCSRRIKNIPFKPLSVRMLEEPFWLGLIAVTVVLSIIGICYLLKKHLPERFDKYLNSEIILKDKHLLGGTADTSHGGGGI